MTGAPPDREQDSPWRTPMIVLALLLAAQFVLPDYHHTNMTRIMIFAVFAIGYNVAFGYAGLLSLGHAMFFEIGRAHV